MGVSLVAGTPDNQRPRLVHADSLVYRQTSDGIVQNLWGNVQLVQEEAYLYCQHAKWWQQTDLLILNTDVAIHDGKRILKADRVTYDGQKRIETAYDWVSLQNESRVLTSDQLTYWQQDEVAKATGHVAVTSEQDSVRIECGSLTYNQKLDYGLLLENPVFIKQDTSEAETIYIYSDTMQVWGETKTVLISHNVRIKKGDLTAKCQQARYLSDTNRLILTQEPFVYYDIQEMSGDSINVLMDGNKFQRVELHGKAEIISTDSTKTDRLQGRHIVLQGIQDSVRTVIINDQAISEYNVTEETTDSDAQTGFNKLTGDRIILTFVNDDLKRVRVESTPGLCTGEFKPEEN